jgi:hypothetical protein
MKSSDTSYDERRGSRSHQTHIVTPVELLTDALYLALSAPDEERAAQATALADAMARSMEAADVEEAKGRALIRMEGAEGDG